MIARRGMPRRILRPPAGPTPRFGRTSIVLQIVAAIAFVALLLHAEGVRLPFTGGDDWRLTAEFADAGGLSSGLHAPVLVSGVPSGRVEEVRYERGRALVTLRLDDAARGIVRGDATAVVEPRSALQDLTVDLRPGSRSAPAARDGGRIATARTVPTITLDRVVDVLDADTRSQLAVVLDQLAVALDDRPGALRAAVAELRPAVDSSSRVAGALSGRRVLLTRLVAAVDLLAGAAGRHAGALAEAVRAGRATVAVTAERDAALRETVQELPATLDTLDEALRRVQSLARPLDPALTRLRATARSLPAALGALRHTTPEARRLVADLDALARDGATPVRDLKGVARRLGPTAKAIQRPVEQLQPIVKAVDERKEGIGRLGETFGGVLSTNDANGPILRGLGFFENFNPANFGFPGASGAKLASVKADVVRALMTTCRRDNQLACLVRYLIPGLPGAVRKP